MYALIDCNNFFVSCERLFRPEFATVPVVVLSSNDGCAISRSAEAKALGITMGEPLHKLRERFTVIDPTSPCSVPSQGRPSVVAYSANFELYGDISERIVSTLCSITPQIEIYSVDEAFLDLSPLDIDNYIKWGGRIRDYLLRHIGIPVSIGVAPTKTLCKLASHHAKKDLSTGGMVYLDPYHNAAHYQQRLQDTAVEAVWGVGWRLAPKLRVEGISTALELARLRPRQAQQLMHIQGRRLVTELSGTACLPLKQATPPQHAIARGRQFGHDTDSLGVITAAVTSLAARAAAELRREHQRAHDATVLLSTNRRKPNYTRRALAIRLTAPTADTGTICRALIETLEQGFEPYKYHKAEVILHNLSSDQLLQIDLLGKVDARSTERSERRMHALDSIRAKYGSASLGYASEHLSTAWQPRKALSSPRYTSHWQELPVATILAD